MKRFAFPLERVLKWREQQVESEELKLRVLNAELQAITTARQQMERDRIDSARALVGSGAVTAGDLCALDSYRKSLSAGILKFEQRAQDCRARIAAQQAEVARAQRNRRMLERLKAKAAARWDVEAGRELETLASEAYLAKWGRN
jgi:flagellar export protein FliJ